MITITSAKNPNNKRLIRRVNIHGGMRYWLLAALILTIIITACQPPPPPATEQWAPPYLKLSLSAGKALVQWPGDSEWIALENGTDIAIRDTGRIIADSEEGAQFSTGDGSIFELSPGAVIEVQNPHTFPHLQVILRDGTLLFTAQKPSYELSTPACAISLLDIPSQIEIEIAGETTRVAVKQGVAACARGEDVHTLPTCYEIVLNPDEDAELGEFCATNTEPPPPTVVASLSPTPWWSDVTVTPSITSTLVVMSTATIMPTIAPITIIPPTDTPLPPPTATFKPRATNTPKPPATSTPKPPATSTPKPPTVPPTDEPQPTQTPAQPTLTPGS